MGALLPVVLRTATSLSVAGGRYLRRRAQAMHSPLRPAALASAAVLALACSDTARVTDPVRSEAPAFAIADGARGFKQGFYWLPPMVENPVTSGTFDAGLSPVVEICALAGDACDPGQDLIATFTTEGSGSSTIRVGEHHYIVNWHLPEDDLTVDAHYRISVFAGPGVLLGYADVEPVTNGGGLKNVDTGEYIGLVENRTLPIKFRIETGFVASIGIEPGTASIPLGQTQQFTATVTDLHGEILAVPVVWTSGDASVASVDGGGLATGVGPGTTTITGTVGHVSASAALTVEAAGGAWAQVSAGSALFGTHTCGVSTAGQAFCWGSGGSGQLGNGGTGDQLLPVAVAGNHQFASISAGDLHTCAVTTDGEAFCWGLDLDGQLGNGGTGDQLSPVAVAGGHRFASISAGTAHTCGVTVNGDALCWGRGDTGQLGDGGMEDRHSPVAVAGNHQFASISAGGSHTCGVTTAGEGLCWGQQFGGLLGNGANNGLALTPVTIAGGHQFASIDAARLHTCGVTTDGDAFCWGLRNGGRLGNGLDGPFSIATPDAVLGNHQFASISTSLASACGVTTAGEAWCWGAGNTGRLGNGGTNNQLTPAAVAGAHHFASVRTGTSHTCGVTTDGEAFCWGEGEHGELGEGRTVNRLVPVRVSDPF